MNQHCGASKKTVFAKQVSAGAEETAGSLIPRGEVTKLTCPLGDPRTCPLELDGMDQVSKG